MHHILKVFLIFILLQTTIADECTDLRFLENRFTCHNDEPEHFPVKGSCTLFMKCMQHRGDEMLTMQTPSVFQCPTGRIFDVTKRICVKVDLTDIYHCPQRRCFPKESTVRDELERKNESTTRTETKSVYDNSKQSINPLSKEPINLQFGQNGTSASSSLISFIKIVISVFLIDFLFVICLCK